MANEEMVITEDFDSDIKKKEELLEEAKNFEAGEDWGATVKAANALQKKWKKISRWDSSYEEELDAKFEEYIGKIYAARNEIYKNAQEAKKHLIEEAKALTNSTEWEKTTKKMSELMEAWKATGMTNREVDDQLWAEFSEARQGFFDAKRAHFAEMKEQFGNAKKIKEALIEKAQELADSQAWNQTTQAFNQLMEEWKAAGSAGREYEDELWNKFHEARQTFFTARNKHYEELRVQQGEHLKAKKDLIAQAREIVETKVFNKENTAKMKEITENWKKVGSAGKANEDNIWNELRGLMDEYFNGLREMNEGRHAAWRKRLEDAKANKQNIIEKQKGQIKRLEQDIVTMLSERQVTEAKEAIEDKTKFIAQLESEIADIDKTLAEDNK
ncbi:MAG: DUF349 domain-containing protein [Erysipelotrichaceae bacterium]|nr:DUF349 domain-containing protein [Erysipelotrichaceae bacterium]